MYKCLKTVWHSKEEKYYFKGESIDLSHLKSEQIAQLIEARVIEKTTKDPVKSGKE